MLCSGLLSSFPQDFLLLPRSGVLRGSCLLFFFFEVFLSISFSSRPFLFFGGEVWPGPYVFGPALGSVDSSLASGKICASVFALAVSSSASFFSLHVVKTEPWSFFIAKKTLVVRRLFCSWDFLLVLRHLVSSIPEPVGSWERFLFCLLSSACGFLFTAFLDSWLQLVFSL